MSYTSELKEELFKTLPNRKDARYLVSGMVLSSGKFIFSEKSIDLTMVSESRDYLEYLSRIMSKYFNLIGNFREEHSHIHKNDIYFLEYENIGFFLEQTGCLSKLENFYYSPMLNDILFNDRRDQRAFLKGVFISCGSILNPQTNYHLELDPHYVAVTEVCQDVLKSLGITCIVGEKYKREVLYIKDSGSIADFLVLIGANKKFFELEDMLIVKQMRGDINRRINFETANINKTALAASRQIASIERLKKAGAYESLPKELKEAAELRVAHPMISMSKLVKKAGFPVSRSSLHRRLTRINEIAKQYE